MTYREIEEYVEFYSEYEQEKLIEYIKLFCISNAESVAVGSSVVGQKKGSEKLKKYSVEVMKRNFKSDKEEFDPEDIEDQFEGI